MDLAVLSNHHPRICHLAASRRFCSCPSRLWTHVLAIAATCRGYHCTAAVQPCCRLQLSGIGHPCSSRSSCSPRSIARRRCRSTGSCSLLGQEVSCIPACIHRRYQLTLAYSQIRSSCLLFFEAFPVITLPKNDPHDLKMV